MSAMVYTKILRSFMCVRVRLRSFMCVRVRVRSRRSQPSGHAQDEADAKPRPARSTSPRGRADAAVLASV